MLGSIFGLWLYILVWLCWWILWVIVRRLAISILSPAYKLGWIWTRVIFGIEWELFGSIIWDIAFDGLSSFVEPWTGWYMVLIHNYGNGQIRNASSLELRCSVIHFRGLYMWFAEYRWLIEPKGYNMAYYAVLYEPRVINIQESHMDYYISQCC